MNIGKSFIKIDVTTAGADKVKTSLIRLADPEAKKAGITAGAEAARSVVTEYYRLRGRDLWVNPSAPTHGPGRKVTQWWRGIANGWFVSSIATNGATLRNSAIGFSHKVTGGVIRAKRKKSLTIPIVPEAHGMTAREYSRKISPLFRVKNVLAESAETPQGFRAVFALRKSVNQKPTPNALPPEQGYVKAFMDAALREIIAFMEK
jgi:hypothetical protein